MHPDYKIRLVTESDVHSVLDIYKYYVENTIISFEYEPPTAEEYVQRIITNTAKYPWLVIQYKNSIIGFAYGSTHRYRSAYQWSPESTIYMSPGFQTRGLGKVLYKTLFSLMKLQGYFNVFAGVGLPNEKSIAFHKSMGFEEIGIFNKIGYKQGNWHDTHWFQLTISKHILNPPPPLLLKEASSISDFSIILHDANLSLKEIKE